MSRSKKEKMKVRVPNPRAPVKRRLKVPSHKVHRNEKGYQRQPKHRHKGEE